jgi:predicted negative regulator of RcsB-dependent stress response
MKKFFSLALLFLLPAGNLFAHYTFTPNLIKAQQAVFELRLYEAYTLIQAERKADPDNRLLDLVETYADCAKLSIDENRTEYKSLLAKREQWDDNEAGLDLKSPYHLFVKGEIAMQWALVKLKYQDYVSAVFDVRLAYNSLDENMELFPKFSYNIKTMGALKTIIGTIPDQYHWVIRMVGLAGSIEEGTALLQQFINANLSETVYPLFRTNAKMQYAYITYFILKNKSECWKQVDELTKDYKTNLFHAWNRAAFAMKCGHTDEAIETLQQAPDQKKYYRFDYLTYLLGLAKLHRLDADADIYLKKYVAEFKGENYLKDACFKLYWFYVIHGNATQAAAFKTMISSIGKAYLDEDKHALKATSEEQDITLLRSRLLFDGGYYDRALKELRTKRSKDFTSAKLKTEFEYRFARIMHEKGDFQKAIPVYLNCILMGEKLPYYYAANSCLQLGYIYEQQNDYPKAVYYYKKCITYTNHEYKNSLAQKAKTGLKRIEEKKKGN